MKFSYKNKKFTLDVKKCNKFQKFRGLMFRKKKNSPALLFEFNKKSRTPLHSFFVFFSFIVVWLDDKNNVIEIKKIKPFKPYINIKRDFNKILEIPLNKKYSQISKSLVENRKI